MAILYWSGRRVSEVLALERNSFVKSKAQKEKPILLAEFKILKKKYELKIRTPIPKDDPIAGIVWDYIKWFDKKGYKGRLFPISPQRAWQIVKDIDPNINDHWWRHVRASHLGTVMGPMELCAYFGWSDIRMALRYTHSNPVSVLTKMESLA